MDERKFSEIRGRLYSKKDELIERLERISLNIRRTLDSDSAERAQQVKDHDVVDALGNDARQELAAINAALNRLLNGNFGICIHCHEPIPEERLAARPHSSKCIECANEAIRTGENSQYRH